MSGYEVTTIGALEGACCDSCAASAPSDRIGALSDWLAAVSPAAWLAGEVAKTKKDPIALVLADHKPQGWGDAMPSVLAAVALAAAVGTFAMYRQAKKGKPSRALRRVHA